MRKKVLVLDFGAQYSQLIARRVREFGVYCEIVDYHTPIDKLKSEEIEALILSGGPSSVNESDAPRISKEIFNLGKPVLGICYGMQLMSSLLGGSVVESKTKEYGHSKINISQKDILFQNIPDSLNVWMSHGDIVQTPPEGFVVNAKSENNLIAAISNESKKFYAVQFHPEVTHTDFGKEILKNFIFKVCGISQNWSMEQFIEEKITEIRQQVSDKIIVTAVSGGVDSTVMAVLLSKAVGKNLHCIFVNNGVLRKNEAEEVLDMYKELGIDVDYIDASDLFLKKLRGISSPEKKRKIIGKTFIKVFFKRAGKMDFLAQGTLYPDVIESVSVKGPSSTIKTHHNRVKEVLNLMKENKVVEPFSELFKDEVREIGQKLNLPEKVIWRQPFPGPGLAIRIISDVTPEKVKVLQESDYIVRKELEGKFSYDQIWQAFAVLLPVKSVGVMGDKRTYENVITLRIVQSVDGMTANWVDIPEEILRKISNRIINEVQGVNRVVYDISSKPPSTIEWE